MGCGPVNDVHIGNDILLGPNGPNGDFVAQTPPLELPMAVKEKSEETAMLLTDPIPPSSLEE